MRQQSGQVLLGFDCRNLIQLWLQRRGAKLFHGRLIHARGKKVTNFLLRGRAPGGFLREIIQNTPKEALIVLGQFSVDAPTRLVGRNRVVLHPAAAGVNVEVHTRVRGFVHGGNIQAGGIGQSGGWLVNCGGWRLGRCNRETQ